LSTQTSSWIPPSVRTRQDGPHVLVLTTLTGAGAFPKQVYQRFAGSLASTGFQGKTVMMVAQSDYDQLGLYELSESYRGLSFEIITPPDDLADINCYRYHHYAAYLRSCVEDFDFVMLSDSRDVLFQRDISKYPFQPGVDLYLFEEEETIARCPFNAGWIRDLFGSQVLDQIGHNAILCSGTTIGTPGGMSVYLAKMCQSIAEADESYHERFGPLGGIDQGIHNYLFHTGKLSHLVSKRMRNSDALVYTLHQVVLKDPHRRLLNGDGRFVTGSGEPCFCVHQFDRVSPRVRAEFNIHAEFEI
jgi:hypothetical protein